MSLLVVEYPRELPKGAAVKMEQRIKRKARAAGIACEVLVLPDGAKLVFGVTLDEPDSPSVAAASARDFVEAVGGSVHLPAGAKTA